MTNSKKRTPLDELERVAYHEAGHAVLSAAINDTPNFVSILDDTESRGRSRHRMLGESVVLVQVHLAGLAAEQIVSGRLPRGFDHELAFSIDALLDPKIAPGAKAIGLHRRDTYKAVQEILQLDIQHEAAAARERFDLLFTATRESLLSSWPVVVAVANALLTHIELDGALLLEAIGAFDIYSPVFAVQEANGLRSPHRLIAEP